MTTDERVRMPPRSEAHIYLDQLQIYYGPKLAVDSITLAIPRNKITAIIGPSGCGKSTLIRTLNRLHETIPTGWTRGRVLLDGEDIFDPKIDPIVIRRRVGMVFQQPNPLRARSISQNVSIGLELEGVGRRQRAETVERCLKRAALWDEVKDRLHQPATALSGGQQQRLCIARTLAVSPEVILMDEPAAALDPIATLRIEELLQELVKDFTIVIVTHNMQQAARVSDYTIFITLGDNGAGMVVEAGPTSEIFTNPRDRRTEDYVTGRFG